MSYEFEGRLKKILPINEVSTTFKKQEFVVVTDEQYPQMIKFEVTQAKISLLSPFFVGDMLQIKFNIRGAEWINPEGKAVYFHSFQAWKINKIVDGYIQPQDGKSPHVQYNLDLPPADEVFGNPKTTYSEDYDDLPF